MNPGFLPDPDQIRRQEEAGVMLLQVGLGLIDDARRGGGFETDGEKLTARVNEILERLGAESPSPGEAAVQAAAEDRERVLLSAPTGEGTSTSSLLRVDGVLLEGYSSISVSAEEVDPAELSPEDQEELRRAQERFEEEMQRLQFQGKRLLRVLTAERQPGSRVQILAAELFDDGLVIHYTYDQDSESVEAIESDRMLQAEPWARIRVADDLGTEYHENSGGGGGMKVLHSALTFTPAVPDAARVLRISSRSGSVELTL
jgi:hypothetical protein